MDAFKGIYWWEWAHRFLGRLLGVAFLVPFLIFLWRGYVRGPLAYKLGRPLCGSADCRAHLAGIWSPPA